MFCMILLLSLCSSENYFTKNVKGEGVLAKNSYVNHPPNPPIVEGPLVGLTRKAYQYNLTLIDPDNDLLIGYEIDFGDTIEGSSCCPIPSNTTLTLYHMWYNPGVYNVKARTKDGHGLWGNWSTPLTVTIMEGDTVPPVVHMLKPNKGLYLSNKRILPFPMNLVIGGITVEVEAVDEGSDVSRVEFYVQGSLKERDYTTPYSWDWYEKSLGRYVLTVKAYDFVGNQVSDEIIVWKFF